jgi:Zn-finger nucleic acid-binding protein
MPRCPVCGTELQLGSQEALDRWTCPSGHGLAMTLSESYERLQEDEIARLWQLAKEAPTGPLASPFDGRPMAHFELPYDDDEVAEGEPGDGPDLGSVAIDVDVANQFIWFDAGELEELPVDRPDAQPSAEVLAAEQKLIAQFAAGLDAAAEARQGNQLTERLYRRVASNPAALSTLDRVGRTLTAY